MYELYFQIKFFKKRRREINGKTVNKMLMIFEDGL